MDKGKFIYFSLLFFHRCPQAGLIGTYDDLLKYVELVVNERGHNGVYYYHWLPHLAVVPVKPHFDMDNFFPSADPTISWPHLDHLINLMDLALNKDLEAPDHEFVVAGSIREATLPGCERRWKHSYHGTFVNHKFASMKAHKQFMVSEVGDMRKEARPAGTPEAYDPSVYSDRHNLRIPWSPKGSRTKKTQVGSELIPMRRVAGGGKDEKDGWEHYLPKFDAVFFRKLDPVPRRPMGEYISHIVEEKTSRAYISPVPIGRDPVGEKKKESEDMMAFFRPLLSIMVEKVQQHRRLLRSGLSGINSASGVPYGKTTTFNEPEWSGREGEWRVKVHGDTFCEHDKPLCYHSSGDKVCLSFNFVNGYYNQLCYACNPRGDELVKYSLFDATGFCIQPYLDSATKVIQVPAKHGAVMFLQSISKDVLYHPSFGNSIYVYDKKSALWVNDQRAIQDLTTRKNLYRQSYNTYCKAARVTEFTRMLLTAEDAKQTAKLRKDFEIFYSADPMKDERGSQFMESLVNNYEFALGKEEDYKFNIFPHLVPMENGDCFNVFTGETVPRTQEMRCTNMMNCSRKVSEDEECETVRAWFLEVAMGRADLCLYLQRLYGYVSTMLAYDRHFYVNLGLGRNGKGVLHKFLKTCFGEGPATGPRYCQLQENFFSEVANSKNSSECCSPALMSMEHKSLYLVEELPVKKLCPSLLKQISANDPVSGRSLYQTSRQIDIVGHLVINSNNCPNIPGEDGACWDRMVLIPWDTRYVNVGEAPNISKWQLPSSSAKIDKLVTMKDAFLTICLNEIHDFYAQTMVDGAPTSQIPLPACIADLTKTKRESCFPLVSFVKKYLVATLIETEFANINRVFYSFKHYMGKKRQVSRQNVTEFTEMLMKVPLEPFFCEAQMESFLKNYKLNPEGCNYAEAEHKKDMDFEGDDEFFVAYKPNPIASGFRRQSVAPSAIAENPEFSYPAESAGYENPVDQEALSVDQEALPVDQEALPLPDDAFVAAAVRRVVPPVPHVPGFPLAHPVPDSVYPLFATEPPAKKARIDMSVRFNCDDY